MPEEFLLGNMPLHSGDDYNDFWQMPTWESLLDLIEEEDITRCDIVVVGKIYRNGQNVGGATFHVGNTDELYNVPEPDENVGNPFNTPAFIERLFGWWGNPPPHVAGIVVRPV